MRRRRARIGWDIEDHVCLACFGRVLSSADGEGRRVFRCSNCGAQGHDTVRAVCACGAKIGAKNGVPRNAGLRCVANDARSPELLSEIIVKEGS